LELLELDKQKYWVSLFGFGRWAANSQSQDKREGVGLGSGLVGGFVGLLAIAGWRGGFGVNGLILR